MLGALRKRKNSPIIMFLLGLTALLMIGFGVSFQGLGTAGAVAHVNGDPINELDFNSRYVLTFREKQNQDRRYDRSRAEKDGLREQVLNGMITGKILSQKGAGLGLAVDDQALRKAITTDPQFQNQGQFDISRYQSFLSYLRTTDRRYEKTFREELLARPLTSVLKVLGPSEAEVRARFERDENKVKVAFVQFEKSAFNDQVGEVTPADVEKWRTDTEDADAKIQSYYTANKRKKYDVQKRVCAQHILVKSPKDTPIDLKAEHRKKIEGALAEVKKGTDFAEVAKKVSEDTSASKGGDLGCFGTGQMVPQFERAAFALEPGKHSGVVTTNFGFHVIKVNEIKPPIRKKLEEVKDEIAAELAKESKASALAQAKAAEFMTLAKAHPDLAAAAKAAEADPPLKVEDSGAFPRSRTFMPKLGAAKDVIAGAWKLTKDAPLPEGPIETQRSWVVMRLVERIKPDEDAYKEKRKFVIYQLTREKQDQLVNAWFKQLREGSNTSFDPVSIRYDDEAQAIRQARRRM